MSVDSSLEMSSRMIVESMEDDEVQFVRSRTAPAKDRSRAMSPATLGRSSDDEGEEEVEVEDLVELFEEEVIDLTGHDLEIGTHSPLDEGQSLLERYCDRSSDTVFARGDCIQVRNIWLGTYEIEFVQIQIIARDGQGEYTIRGIPFVRTRKLQGKLPKKLNEVCMMLHIQRRDNGEELPALLVDVPIISIVKIRELVITNAVYPTHCHMPEVGAHIRSEDLRHRLAESFGNLVCRWKFTVYFTMQHQHRATKPVEEVLERVQSDEVSLYKYRVSDEALCNQWRGGRIKGGSWPSSGSKIIDLEAQTAYQDTTTRRKLGQKYTLFDSFSGAGGVSRGAQSAGFKVQYAVDKWADV